MPPHFGYRIPKRLSCALPLATLTLILTFATPAAAQFAPADRVCDTAFEDCRATILEMIERNGRHRRLYWFMTDWRYSSEIIKRWQAGVPVRIVLDTF